MLHFREFLLGVEGDERPRAFGDHCSQRDFLLGEAQSRGDPKGIQIPLDDEDRDFIAQAAANGISAVSALRSRYTVLLQDKPGESGPVRFFGSGRRPFVTVRIERTHLKHLQDKLRAVGAANVAEHGFRPLQPLDPAAAATYYNAAFGRQNAADILRRGKAIEINYGRSVETAVAVKAASGSQEPDRLATVRPIPNDWSSSYLRSLFQDKDKVSTLQAPSDEKHDLTEVWRAVQSLVGDTRQRGKYILPEVWQLFQKALPQIGKAIFDGVIRQLKQFDPSAVENALEVHQAMMQTTAMILSSPLRGARTTTTGDFLGDVENLFANRDALFKLAMSYTSQGHLRKSSGIDTTNTRRREIGGVMTAKPLDLDTFGKEDDPELTSDTEIAAELAKLEPAVDRIRAKLQWYKWDTSKLDDHERDLFNHYEDLTKKLQRFQQLSRGGGQWTGASTLVRKPTINPQQSRMDQIEAELEGLGPKVQPIIGKLDVSNWNMSRVSDNEWGLYQHYKQLERELNRLKGMPLVDVDDLKVGSQHQFSRQPAMRSEDTCHLGFRDWLKDVRESEQASCLPGRITGYQRP